ncbi:hypothetical protein NX059_010760 [Plenodomus lindquistii]|nr:hypothetical protein NX059_010760 [Plenodomus lindquistii]
MANITRSISGMQANFGEGCVLTNLKLDTGKLEITSEVAFGVYGDGVLFHMPITRIFGLRDVTMPGPVLQSWRFGLSTKNRRISREMMRFANPSDALLIMQPVVIKSQPEPVVSQFLYSVVIEASKDIHHSVKNTVLRRLEGARVGRELTFNYRSGSSLEGSTKTISIHDVDRQHLSDILDQVSAVYQGHIARHAPCTGISNCAIWHPFFDTKPGHKWIRDLSDRSGSVIHVDARQHQIRLYGNPVKSWTNHMIDLELSRKWMDVTKEATSTPLPQDCPICLRSTTDIHLSCGHNYCSDCFDIQIHSAVSDLTSNKQFPVRCWHTDCLKRMSLYDLQLHLPFEKFEGLLKASLLVSIRSHPSRYRYCPQPDCTGVYLASEEDTFRTCPVCFNPSICSDCDARAHPGLNCAQVGLSEAGPTIASVTGTGEWHFKDSDGNNASIKQCPKCEMLTQKGLGCAHMKCICGVHWCWVCRADFEGPKDGMTAAARCYEHMEKVHESMCLD